jgi:hypothetical protein
LIERSIRALFDSGRIVDLIIGVLIAEVMTFIIRRRGSATNAAVAALPGICLLLALRASLTGANWTQVAFWLALSFPAHLADLWRRPP